MCGITGCFGDFNHDCFMRSLNAISHRGPDDQGFWADKKNKLSMGHKRLSIQDLSSAGHQPFLESDERFVLVYNGEIYNAPQLRKQLEKRGVIFRGHSDTEILFYLLKLDGVKSLTDLNGIFSFAFWDSCKQELLIARDHFGVKPLYYSENNYGFLFASELKALLKYKNLSKDISIEAIKYYISSLWCPAPLTPLENVKKLEPGTYLIIRDQQIIKKEKFYNLQFNNEISFSDIHDLTEQFSNKLERAIERQMISDVPVGAFLSGGLDSTAVVNFARKFSGSRMKCFTIGFENSTGEFDGFTEDLPYAEQAAHFLDVDLHKITVGPSMMDRLEDMIYHLDEPQADPAPLNALFISELARSHGIKVLLSGAGGDDILSGYRRHQALIMEKYWSWLPLTGRKLLKKAASLPGPSTSFGRRLAKAFKYSELTDDQRLISYFHWLEQESVDKLFNNQDIIKKYDVFNIFSDSLKDCPASADNLTKMLYLELKHFLADHNLNYTDKMGMAAGVEVRVPFLDPELVEFCFSIKSDYKICDGKTKYIFRKAMEKHLPYNIIYRPKSGFGAPLRKWLHGPLKDLQEDLLSENSLNKRGIFAPIQVRKLLEADSSGKIDAAYNIFSLMCIEWWFRIFIDGNS